MADFTWVGGASGNFFLAANWNPLAVPTYGTIAVPTGTTIVVPFGNQATLDGLVMTGPAGTVTLAGGSFSFNNGLTPPAGYNVTLSATKFSTTSPLGVANGGTITLNGATVTGGGSAATGTFIFDSVSSSGSANILAVTDQSKGLVLQNLGFGDQIRLGSGNTMSLTLNAGSTSVYTLTDDHGGSYSTVVSSNVTLAPGTAPSNFISSGGTLLYNGAPPCFYAGTRLATADGDIAVEDITAATRMKTASGEIKPVRWLGRSEVSTRFADPLRVLPIRIKAGALGESLPLRDLLVSPDHAMFIGGVLVQAGAMVNGSSIIREADVPECFTYYHVELATHELLLAEGAATESFVDNVDRMGFANWAEHEALGETAPIEEMDIPRAKSQRQVPVAVRALLAARALAFQDAAAA
ncbi:hypothetical protein GCM10010909_05220 [Acidocella aquatica]|uniref:Hedgehog/Intein (Hint) domain-containing protein n=1 Tax=Acidocella aquatica TaxID=1922313 RepID=A0ABQ6A070_9PROT|nr:Hint domain-containing protein [Acidocella aquatica]GLR65844.1 hypothetical protein GCM10010909_05220 [Acidocella aquatica]